MKKILGVLIILVVFLGIYSIYQIGNAFSSDIPDIAIEENIDILGKYGSIYIEIIYQL